MSPSLRLALPATLAAMALASAPGVARAHGDPPGARLLVADIYLPFQPAVSKPLGAALDATVARAKQAGYSLKVALVAGEPDLGAIAHLFNKPDAYAQELARELPTGRVATLVVMPTGLAVAKATQPAVNAIADVEVDQDERSDGLARAAIEAIPKMASASGVAVPETKLPPGPGKDEGGTSPVVFGAPVVVVALAALAVGLRRRRADELPTRP